MYQGGFGGNMQNILRQAQKMQQQLAEQNQKAEEELAHTTLTASSGGGMVTVAMTGKREVKSVTISPQVVDPDDIEMLQDLVLSCLNDVLAQVEKLEEKLKPQMPTGL